MNSQRLALYSLLLVTLLSVAAGAQTSAGSETPPPPEGSGTIRLTPPMPDGGVYGSTPSAPAPTEVPPAATPAVTTPPPPPSQDSPPAAMDPTAAPATAAPTDPTAAPGGPPRSPYLEVQPGQETPFTQGSPFVVPSPRSAMMRARLHLLNTSLPPLAQRSRRQRLTSAVLDIGIGIGFGILGFLAPVTASFDLRPYIWTMAGVSILSGGVDLLWVPERETLTHEFEAMPMSTARQRRARVRFGEHALDSMAADGSRRRVITSLGSMVIPLVLLGVIYAPPLLSGTPYTVTYIDYLLIAVTGVQIISSIMGIFSRSEEERLRDSYRAQTQLMDAESRDLQSQTQSQRPLQPLPQ